MKALSVRQPWAQWIANGEKTVEVRSRPTHHRGPLVICSSSQTAPAFRDYVREIGLPLGRLICVVNVVDCVPMTEEHFDAACFLWDDLRVLPEDGAWAWLLADARIVEPVPKKGKLNLWNVDDAELRYLYECPACRDPHRDLVPVYVDAAASPSGPEDESADRQDEDDEDEEVACLRCEACGAEFHELTTDEFGYIRIAADADG